MSATTVFTSGPAEIEITNEGTIIKTIDPTTVIVTDAAAITVGSDSTTFQTLSSTMTIRKGKPRVAPQPKRLRPIVALPMCYSPSECIEMYKRDHLEFCVNVTRITGITELTQAGWAKPKPITTHWSYSILNRCMKKGLYASMKMPLTADAQTMNNDERNPYNNPAYSILYDADASVDEKKGAVKWRVGKMASIGVEAKPRKHKA